MAAAVWGRMYSVAALTSEGSPVAGAAEVCAASALLIVGAASAAASWPHGGSESR